MKPISEILNKRKLAPVKVKKILPWQVRAVEVATSLSIKPDSQWFKAFKYLSLGGMESWIDIAYSFVSDANCYDKKKLFYWKLSQLKNAYILKAKTASLS